MKDKSRIAMHLTMYFLDWLAQKEVPNQEVPRVTKEQSAILGASDFAQ